VRRNHFKIKSSNRYGKYAEQIFRLSYDAISLRNNYFGAKYFPEKQENLHDEKYLSE
jgi:hypothetical protein